MNFSFDKTDNEKNLEAQRNRVDQRGEDEVPEDFNWEECIFQELEAELREEKEEDDAEEITDKIILELLYIEESERLVSRTFNAGRWTGSN